MCRFSCKKFRTDNHFIIYGYNDSELYYIDNFDELTKYISYTLRDLVKEFNKRGHDDIINIIIGNIRYQLYTFVD